MSIIRRLPDPEVPDCPTLEFRADVLHGLGSRPRSLPCRYFYDDIGSDLFEQITDLEEYYPTRTERAIMDQHAAEMASLLGPNCLLLEYGSGSSSKTRMLLDHLPEPAGYVPLDVSGGHLHRSAAALRAEYPGLEVLPLCADFTRPLRVPRPKRRADRRVVYFPGSTIGNFTPRAALTLLRRTARRCGPGGGLLLGVDLQKDPRVIEAAYNDARGVTAAFNRNLLARINRELGGDFDLDQFAHRAFYCTERGRIEMHLVSRRDQRVHIGNAEFSFTCGETIHTENSHKYRLGDLRALARDGGFEMVQSWTDERNFFCLAYFTVRRGGER